MPHMLVIESNTGDEFAVEHRLQCSRWRSQAVYMDSMRGIADISSLEHDQPASRGSCNVHLSWQQQRTGRKSMMTVCSSWRNAAALLMLCLLAIPGQSQDLACSAHCLASATLGVLAGSACMPSAGS